MAIPASVSTSTPTAIRSWPATACASDRTHGPGKGRGKPPALFMAGFYGWPAQPSVAASSAEAAPGRA
jgi:hypothetical protein